MSRVAGTIRGCGGRRPTPSTWPPLTSCGDRRTHQHRDRHNSRRRGTVCGRGDPRAKDIYVANAASNTVSRADQDRDHHPTEARSGAPKGRSRRWANAAQNGCRGTSIDNLRDECRYSCSTICAHSNQLAKDYPSQSAAMRPPRSRTPAEHAFRRWPSSVGALGHHICRAVGPKRRSRPASLSGTHGGQGLRTLLQKVIFGGQRLPSGSISTVIRLSPERWTTFQAPSSRRYSQPHFLRLCVDVPSEPSSSTVKPNVSSKPVTRFSALQVS